MLTWLNFIMRGARGDGDMERTDFKFKTYQIKEKDIRDGPHPSIPSQSDDDEEVTNNG